MLVCCKSPSLQITYLLMRIPSILQYGSFFTRQKWILFSRWGSVIFVLRRNPERPYKRESKSNCISCCPIAVVRHHDQGNLQKKKLTGTPIVEHGSSQTGMMLEQETRAYILLQKNKAERELTGNGWTLKTSMPTPNDTPPPLRPHLPILPRKFNQLETKHLHIWPYLGYSYSNQHTSMTRLSNNWLEAVQWAPALRRFQQLVCTLPNSRWTQFIFLLG